MNCDLKSDNPLIDNSNEAIKHETNQTKDDKSINI